MMEINVSSETLERICSQLTSEHRPGRSDGNRTAHQDVLREGWGMHHDLHDILWETDGRAEALARHLDFECLLEPYKLNWTSCYRRPSASAKEAWGGPAMRAADLAMLIMEIERLGFTVDAEPLVRALRPEILKQKRVSQSELAILWYQRDRHRYEPIILMTAGRPDRVETVTTNSGYKATILLEGDRPVILRVDPSKGRKGFPLKYWTPYQLRLARLDEERS